MSKLKTKYSRRNYADKLEKLIKLLKESLGKKAKVRVEFEQSAAYDDKFYLTISYELAMLFGDRSTDEKVHKALHKSGLGRYFTESGSGGGFNRRDIGFIEK